MFPKRQNKKNHATIKNKLRNGWLGLFQTFSSPVHNYFMPSLAVSALRSRPRRMQLNCQDEMCKATSQTMDVDGLPA